MTTRPVSARPLRDAQGNIRGASLVYHDITDVQEAERKLQQSQKLEAIGKLTGGVAHDFNNMLTVIAGTMEVLMDELKDRPDALQTASLIDQATERCTELIQHLLAFARKQPLRPRNVELNGAVVDIAKLLRPTLGEQIEIESALAADAWPALIDPSLLTNAVLNLAINARDAMPKGGQLTLETRNVMLDEAYAKENAKLVILAARRRAGFDYEEFDIDADPELRRLYNEEVPVIAIDRRKAFKYRVDMDAFLKRLARR